MDNSVVINPDEVMATIRELVQPSDHWLSNLANTAAFVYETLPDVSWVGWYLYDGEALRLGPFQGPVACTVIAPNKGVCGAAFSQNTTQIVEDVHAFPGHIACDPMSKSELVIPFGDTHPLGVLDLDSYSTSRFTASEAELCRRIVEHVVHVSDFTKSLL